MSHALPVYEVRISTKAKLPQIRILPPDRVEVVLPQGVAQSVAAELVAAKAKWIRNKLALYAHLQDSHAGPSDDVEFPEHVHLAAIDRRFRVEYRPTRSAGVRATLRDGLLTLSGAVEDAIRVRASLKRWLLATARTELPPMLHELAASYGFTFRQASVRYQKQRWGSCSSHKHIILNAKLLCLPKSLAQHVMLHELAHLKHLNHSRSFWALLQGLDANADHHHAQLRSAWLHVPDWLEAG